MDKSKPCPCPWCGKLPTIERGGPGNLVWYIKCEGDDPEHTVTLQNSGTRKQAIAAWNTCIWPVTRADLDAANKRVMELEGALREARPYINTHNSRLWKCEYLDAPSSPAAMESMRVSELVDAALATPNSGQLAK